MKVKMLVAMGLSALLASAVSIAAPGDLSTENVGATPVELTDDAGGPTQTPGMDTNNANGSMQNNEAAPGNAGSMSGMNSSNTMPQNPADTSNSNDDMSADTATGDDDY